MPPTSDPHPLPLPSFNPAYGGTGEHDKPVCSLSKEKKNPPQINNTDKENKQ